MAAVTIIFAQQMRCPAQEARLWQKVRGGYPLKDGLIEFQLLRLTNPSSFATDLVKRAKWSSRTNTRAISKNGEVWVFAVALTAWTMTITPSANAMPTT